MSAGAKRTVIRCFGPRATSREKRIPSMAPRRVPLTGCSVVFQTSAETVSSADFKRRKVQAAGHERVPQRERPAVGEVHRAPQAHVLVRRHGVPVHPVEGQVGRLRGEDLDRERVARAGLRGLGHVQLVAAEGAHHVLGRGQLLAVQPDVGAVVHAVEVEPQAASGQRGRAASNSVRYHQERRNGLSSGMGRCEKFLARG